ncbi:MAG: N-acetylmuramidase family protein [Lepagella sp.]
MKFPAILLLSSLVGTGVACGQSNNSKISSSSPDSIPQARTDSLSLSVAPLPFDSIAVNYMPIDSIPDADKEIRYDSLSDEDFEIVARELDVEVAAIKAVVQIEAGKAMKGFLAPGVPIVNFDASMYRAYAHKAKNKKGDPNAKVPQGLSGYGLREWQQLVAHRKKNCDGANMGTFWGMFQIGGFNYKICSCESVDEFVELMSKSEFAQLELFARLIVNTGMVKDLKAKNWAGFARRYNGASYKRRGYHTKMAAAYQKFKAQEKK